MGLLFSNFARMKQRMIVLATVMLSVALVGLMLIQGYWIVNAYRVKEAGFVRTVNEAAHEVIITLEKMELARRFQQPALSGTPEEFARQAVDSINQVLLREMQMIATRKDLDVFVNKFFIARELMEDRMFSQDDPLNRKAADPHLIDSLLTDEFEQRKMDIEWVSAIFNPHSRDMVSASGADHKDELLDADISFHFELFPDDMHQYPDFLLIYFPDEREYLIGQVWPLVSISILLIIIIILSFIYTLMMFFRQGKLSELKTDFINNMTHEFKTPVSTISLACEALNDKDIKKSDDLYRNYINIISEENRRLGLMAERILQSARLEKGELTLNREPVDLHQVLSDVIRNIGIQVEIKDGQITRDFRAKNSIVEADHMHLVNIVQNLLDNANMYSPVRPHIAVATRDSDGGIVFSVQDNGIGISKTDQKKIFEKLYRVPEGNIHNFKGFGLGLSYVKTVVEQHGGTIKVESELKKGTKFEIYLPQNQH